MNARLTLITVIRKHHVQIQWEASYVIVTLDTLETVLHVVISMSARPKRITATRMQFVQILLDTSHVKKVQMQSANVPKRI